ncbi:MAG: ATP-binding protein, partial [Lachnospiraceae bacterium]|nr:ATP-binding protein [Lachnospiraceae bacterium]
EATGKTPMEHAHFAVQKSMEFIDHFQESGGNLFIYGDTGVGKTFLSHCIAHELIHQGISVLYFSSYELFQLLADQAFSRDTGNSSFTMDSICDVDLLIIDDLGTEMTNNFIKTQLFSILNDRLIKHKSTIISTNYDIETFSNVYTTRIFSRVMQSYTLLNLIGQDIRVQKALGGNIK